MVYRIYVDLPDAQNRMKILKILLAKEKLEYDFKFDELANATEGYSGSDLKVSNSTIYSCQNCYVIFSCLWSIHCSFLQNLCIAAAYRPVHELLEEEKKVIGHF
jgi:hypothetical protein